MTIIRNITYSFFLTLAIGLLIVTLPTKAQAQAAISNDSAEIMDMPTMTETQVESMTHPILRITPDKSEMVKLDQEAASVIVGNPNHVSVLLDTPNTLVVVPRAEGASHFTVLGKDGSVLMQRHVIVGAAKDNYVRIRRSCGPADRGCQPTSVYFCPDMCHEVKENTQGSRSGGFRF